MMCEDDYVACIQLCTIFWYQSKTVMNNTVDLYMRVNVYLHSTQNISGPHRKREGNTNDGEGTGGGGVNQ
jgi:hypothetical protein